MNKLLENAFRQMEDARPASGYRPETEEERAKLYAAHAKLMYAAMRSAGVSVQEAQRAKHLMPLIVASISLIEMRGGLADDQ